MLPEKLRSLLHSKLQALKSQTFEIETENQSLKMDNTLLTKNEFMAGYKLSHSLFIRCIDMHTGGEPLRIIDSLDNNGDLLANGIPLDLNLQNKSNVTLLSKRLYMKENLDNYRKFLMYEPRGHSDMYGALITKADNSNEADFGVLFMHNEGYSTMCGHAVIALTRYAVDCGKFKLNKKNDDEHENKQNGIESEFKNGKIVRIQTPCGIVKASAEIDETSGKTNGNVSFLSAPGWAEQLNQVELLLIFFAFLECYVSLLNCFCIFFFTLPLIVVLIFCFFCFHVSFFLCF